MSRSVSRRRGGDSEPRISEVQKKELLILCHDWIKWGHSIKSYGFVTRLANALLERDWRLKGEPTGSYLYETWGYNFCRSHPSLKSKVNKARVALSQDEEVCTKEWVANVRSLCKQYDINPENMHTVKEIGYFTLKNHHTKAVILSRPQDPDIDLRPMASAIHSFSGAGIVLSPWAMFKEDNHLPYARLARVHMASNKTGWPTRHDFNEWLVNHFEPRTRQWDPRRPIWRLMLRRDDLDPFNWGVFKTIEREYKRWLYLRWKAELEKNNSDGPHDNISGQVNLKRIEFAGILSRITVAGKKPILAQRKAEAENAWKTGTLFVVSSASTGAPINRFEDTQHLNTEHLGDTEQEEDYFIVDDEDDLLEDFESSSQTVDNSVYEDEEDVQSISSESTDSADESYDDCSYAEPSVRKRSRSRAAETPTAPARVTRSQSRARSMALTSGSRTCSPDKRRRRSPSPLQSAYRQRGRSRSRPELETPSRQYVRVRSRPVNNLPRQQSEHSRYHYRERYSSSSPAPGPSSSVVGPSPLTSSSSVAVHSSPSFSPGSDLITAPETTRRRTVNDIIDDHNRAMEALEILPVHEREVHEQTLKDNLCAQILASFQCTKIVGYDY
ncbi:hypothetical protein N7540_005722 [Penicillium herquei]|nr:hypothetical protein N7540_005722 [Penicillium herquei]